MADVQEMKLEKFLNVIRQEQEQQVHDIERETDLLVEQELEKAENKALRESYHYIQRAGAQLRSETGKRISLKENQNRADFLSKREQLIGHIIEISAEKLKAFTGQAEYLNFLSQSAAAIEKKLSNRPFSFMIGENDAEACAFLAENYPKINLEKTKTIRLGGFMAKTADGKTVLDDTLDSRLKQESEFLRNKKELGL